VGSLPARPSSYRGLARGDVATRRFAVGHDLLVVHAGSSSHDAAGRVYLLWHVDLTGGEEDAILIGVYSTGDLAEMAARRLSSQPGFVDLPAISLDEPPVGGGFPIESYVVDRDHWTAGYRRDL
jgi:hypothetical protein